MIISIEGTVAHGKQLGRTLGYPTANVAVDRLYPLPQNGVYAALLHLEGDSRVLKCMLNQGKHPTVPDGAPTIEAHILDFAEDIYGARVRVDYMHFVRPEYNFGSLEKLVAQLDTDKEAVAGLLRDY